MHIRIQFVFFHLKRKKKDEISAFYLQLKFRLSHYKQNEGGGTFVPSKFFNSVVYQSSDPLSKYSPGYNSPNFSVAVFSINSFVLIYSFFFFNSFFFSSCFLIWDSTCCCSLAIFFDFCRRLIQENAKMTTNIRTMIMMIFVL